MVREAPPISRWRHLPTGEGTMALSFESVSFGYGRSRQPVLDRFSWQVPSGRTVLLGPNGAGKSTLLALGADALRPASGRIRIGALDPTKRTHRALFRRSVGWMPQHARAVPGLTVHEQVAYAGWLKGLSRSDAWTRANEALVRVGLSDLPEQKSATLSGGQLRRMGLAQVLVHEPVVMLLDEPTAGLDPAQRATFRDLIAGLPPDRPVVVSTHQVDDLTELFDQVVVIETGTVLFAGSVRAFMALAPNAAPGRQAEAAYAQIVSGER